MLINKMTDFFIALNINLWSTVYPKPVKATAILILRSEEMMNDDTQW
jgi:hypothetical protein